MVPTPRAGAAGGRFSRGMTSTKARLSAAASAEEDGDQVAEAEPPPRTSVQMQIKGWSYELDL